MSDGLKLIASIVTTGSTNALLRMEREKFTGDEQTVFDFVFQHHRRYRALPDMTTINTEVGVRLPSAPETLQFYVDQVEDRYVYNAVRERYTELRTAMTERDIEGMRPLVAEMNQIMGSRRAPGQQVATMGEGLGMVVDRLVATRGYGGITGIETPWNSFNEITSGYQNADLVTLVGRPGTAKTYNLLTQAMGAHAAGHSALIVTTEMGIEQISRRYVALRLGINPDYMKRNMLSTYSLNRIRALQAEMMQDDNLRIFSVGMGAKISAIEALLQEFMPSIVFLDGTYLVHPSVKTPMKRIERVGEVFDELKGLTISANIPIVNTMQFNRQAGKDGKDGSLENIGFTDAVGMHSSLVIGLKMGPTEDPRKSRTMEFLKGREGEIGEVHMNFKFAPVDMSELDPALIANGPDGEPVGEAAGSANVDWMM